MKKLLCRALTLTALLALCLCLVPAAFADGGIAIDETSFPDPVFRAYVAETCDTDSNGTLSDAEIANVTKIDVGSNKITSLAGIEVFTALTELYCYDNQLTTLDVSGCTALTELHCYNNQLTTLDVSGCSSLNELSCGINQLTQLDVRECSALTDLYCHTNQLKTLDVSRNENLNFLSCGNNELTSLDLSANSGLEKLQVYGNKLTSLDLGSAPGLRTLNCGRNSLKELDLSKNPELVYVGCAENQLSSLTLDHANLLALTCPINQITSLDVSKCPLLCDAILNGTMSEADYEGHPYRVYAGSESLDIEAWGTISQSLTVDADVTLVTAPVSEPDLVLPDNLTAIESEAFAGGSFASVYIPPKTTVIADDAFGDRDELVIFGEPDSYAREYAEQAGFPFVPAWS